MLQNSQVLYMRVLLITGFIAVLPFTVPWTASAQSASINQWTWMGGSTTASWGANFQPGIYGTLGIPAAGNIPGARVYAMTWTDNSGNFWLFGGQGYDANGNQTNLNDLWEFNPSSNQWAWMGGSSTVTENSGEGQSGVYGTLGTPAPGNVPGSRLGALSWTDGSGNLWLFGGNGWTSIATTGYLNDLWEFNPSTNEWTWMSGIDGYSRPGLYGTLGTPDAANLPGGRWHAVNWTDRSGNLWLFGGEGIDVNGNYGVLNDLWKFNPSSSEWTWMGGSSSVPVDGGNPGLYGALGTPAAGNISGGRAYASGWTDSSGNFWLFGGLGDDANGSYDWRNDLWEFNPSTNLWAWEGGSSTIGKQPGMYGALGTPAAGNMPGARDSAASWTDSSGKFWLFGGDGFDAFGDLEEYLNDLWMFDPSTSEWTWTGGSSGVPCTFDHGICGSPGVYGMLGDAAAGNVPGTRAEAAGWTDSSGNLWLFGGFGDDAIGNQGVLNDLWESQRAAAPLTAAATPAFSVAAGGYPTPQIVSITDATAAATIYYTTDGTMPSTASTVYTGAITVSSSTETLEAIATASGYLTSALATAAYTINLPVLGSMTPAFVSAGSVDFTLTINGSGFTPNSTIYWGTTALSTTYVNATQLTAQVPAADVANGNIAFAITVENPPPGGGTSGTLTFQVDSTSSSSTPPAFTSTTTVVAAGATATYTVTLPPSVTASTVSCLNLPLNTSCSYTTGTVTITTSVSTPPGTYQITVVFNETVSGPASGWVLLPFLLLPMVLLRKRLAEQGVWTNACLGLVLLAATAVAFVGCGQGGGGTSTTTPPQTQQVISSGAITLKVT